MKRIELRPGTFLLISILMIFGCGKGSSTPQQPVALQLKPAPNRADGLPAIKDPQPDQVLEHDRDSFTQGLLVHQDKIFESTGRNGLSKLRQLRIDDGKVEKEVKVSDEHFAEGLALLDNKFYQLTWQSGVCLVYTPELKLEKTLFYGTEGWGLTVDPNQKLLVFSDGSSELRFLDPKNLITKKKLTVTDGNNEPVTDLNELEWVNGEVWANVWNSDSICRIDPSTGKALGWIKFDKLVREHQKGIEDVLNGIAYDPNSDQLWLTGKLWEKIYRFDRVKETFFKN